MIRSPLLILALLLTAAGPSLARDYRASGLRISHPWTRPAAAGQNRAGYVTIPHAGNRPAVLLSARAHGVDEITLHQSMMQGEVAMMMPVVNGLTIPPGKTLSLSPGGYHLMFVGLAHASDEGGRLPVTLVFARAGPVTVNFSIEAYSAARPANARR